MGSLGSGEILVIAVAALIVFGPKRLPEIARKASQILAKTREATQSVTSALDNEFDGVTAPLQSLKAEYDATVRDIKGAATSVGDLAVSMPTDDELPGEAVGTGDSRDETRDIADLGSMAVVMPLDDTIPGDGEPSDDASGSDAEGDSPPVDDGTSEGESAAS